MILDAIYSFKWILLEHVSVLKTVDKIHIHEAWLLNVLLSIIKQQKNKHQNGSFGEEEHFWNNKISNTLIFFANQACEMCTKKLTDSWNSILLQDDDYILAFHATVDSSGSHSSQELQTVTQMIGLLVFFSLYMHLYVQTTLE